MGINWLYNDTDFTEEQIGEFYGFVYLITNLKTGRKYIGKKYFYSSKIKSIKGKKKKIKVSSNWKTYFGSNAELLSDVKELGEENFSRIILLNALTSLILLQTILTENVISTGTGCGILYTSIPTL